MNNSNSYGSYGASRGLRVAVVGAGLGGLCLARRLSRAGAGAGVHVEVYERDASPWERAQGYRLHLDADGINALHDSLSPSAFARFDATAMKAKPFTTIVDTALDVKMRRSHDQHGGTSEAPHDGLPAHVNVNRATLREILLGSDSDADSERVDVKFGKKLASYAETPDGVVATFEDGLEIEADVLVGADGIRSPVRSQRAPHARVQDSGIRAIYGRIPLAAAKACLPAHALEDVFTVAVDDRKCFLGLGPVVFPTSPASLGLRAQDDYVVCIVGGREELFSNYRPTAEREDARRMAESALAPWPAATRDVLRHADPTAFFLVEMFTSVPTSLTAPTRTTLLGDAIHAMTPTLGRGANLAMRDGARLAAQLIRVANGEVALQAALAEYEVEMLTDGFDVVRAAAAMGERLMGQRPLPSD